MPKGSLLALCEGFPMPDSSDARASHALPTRSAFRCPECGTTLSTHVSAAPVWVTGADGVERLERAARMQCLRVLHIFDSHRGQWMTEAEVGIALGSTAVHSRMSNLRDVHGDLWEERPGPKDHSGRPRKLYRLKDCVTLRPAGEA